jgi:uncharacterized membrane protein YphA (DoxX/SURF4 family)
MVLEALAAYESWAFLGLRTALAAVFLYHGIPKLQDPTGMAEQMGMPTAAPFLIGLVEVVGSLAVILGVYARWGALGLSIVMLGALYVKIVEMEAPFSAMDQMGWEFDLVLLTAAVLVLVAGPGGLIL